jgi:hypothetical protein
MPDRNHPDRGAANAVVEAVRPENDLAVRKLGELGKPASETRERFERTKPLLGPDPEAFRG